MSEPADRQPAETSPGAAPPAGAGPLVVLDAVAHAYARTPALRGVSLAVAPGEVVALTGPSGGGKSTLLHVAAGLLAPQAGRVRLLGQDLAGLGEAPRAALRRRGVGIVLQYGQLVPDLPLVDDVALPLLLEGSALEPARTAAREALALVGLEGLGDAVPAGLSGGQAQRAAVARALVAQPRLVLADEPVASLDPEGGRQVLDLLVSVARRGGGLLLVTHDNAVAARADREVRLSGGVVAHEAVLR
ncbi:ATP-binding cassette domain-containing protein [Pseudokineococcus marinus]|uniref:ATP-binding cassette domain-containing protein n=1 Tax=Pseudokineococcus marinus TaxID=351215 RepID=A0A849BGG9_9ACTN|nr:ATP-binding cassette domain-containing protein [Pseudokineococcus marinus]NNH22190.1 ATP-binding cassette domain-containing protein [Pseudokineococcus marinus]